MITVSTQKYDKIDNYDENTQTNDMRHFNFIGVFHFDFF